MNNFLQSIFSGHHIFKRLTSPKRLVTRLKPAALAAVMWLSPSIVLADINSALAAFDARNYAAAKPKLETALADHATSPKVIFPLAVTAFRTGDVSESQEYLDALFEVEPNHMDGLFLQGMVHMARLEEVSVFKKLGVAKSARQSWQQMVDVQPENVTGNYALFSFYFNAPGIAGGSKSKAQALIPVLEANSAMYGNLANGLAKENEGDLISAEHFFKAATEADSGRATPWFGLARFYFDNDRHQEALQALAEFEQRPQIWHDPDQAMTHFYRGSVLAKLGRTDEAKQSWDAAMTSNPSTRVRGLVKEALEAL